MRSTPINQRQEALRNARREADLIPDDRRAAYEARFEKARAEALRHITFTRR